MLTEKKWSSDVKTKWKPEEGFFTKSAAEIVAGLLAAGESKAMSRLNFFINRAGKKLDEKDLARLEKAKTTLEKKLAAVKEEVNSFRKMAGLPLLEKKEDPEADMDLDDSEEAPAPKKGEEEEALPKIVTKIAKQAEGKDAEVLEALIMKVYEAGFKDGVKSTEESKEKKGAEVPPEEGEEE